MVDFTKRLASRAVTKISDPLELYKSLDRNADTGTLRPSQEAILKEWYEKRRDDQEVILKLHTGQGKTLVGLLILQSKINSGKSPVVYLCPNNFLLDQTIEQAKRFGIKTCRSDGDLPAEFLSGEKILVTTAAKLFNGFSKFGLDRNSISVDTVLMDDSHACVDKIRDACKIKISSDDPAFEQLRTLFYADLERQGMGTFAEILLGKRDAVLPVPYWSWIEREADVVRILAAASERKSIKFTWPILKDVIRHCQCVISGSYIEIEPHVAPLRKFGSFWKAAHKVFMSATVTDDAFLIRGLQLMPESIKNPLQYLPQKWSGEKMILIPSLISPEINREVIVNRYAPPERTRSYGVVALCSSFNNTADWEKLGAKIAKTDDVWKLIEALREGQFSETLVLANRYDGIDLPDDSCRVLILDRRPFSESLIDTYEESCRPESDSTLMRLMRTIEQGMGRSVRGEKDYSIVIVLGEDLVRVLRDERSKKYLSSQASTQIDIGLQVASFAKDDINQGAAADVIFQDLVRKCLQRDVGWKAFYDEQMQSVTVRGVNERLLDIYSSELTAENAAIKGNSQIAADLVQKMIDKHQLDTEDRGWYLQMMARFLYLDDKLESDRLQAAAHSANHAVMLPPKGIDVRKLRLVSQGRIESIAKWIRDCGDYPALSIKVGDILARLRFGTKADKFEHALDELSRALGFVGERPDKEWKEGPDNLWCLDDRNYIVWECKSEVITTRAEIHKTESDQMNRSAAWFEKHYAGHNAIHIEIHPTNVVPSSAHFLVEVGIMRDRELRNFVRAVEAFFSNFERLDFNNLSLAHIQILLVRHALTVENLLDGGFTKRVVNLKE